MSTTQPTAPLDDRVRGLRSSTKLVYLVLRNHGPLSKSAVEDRVAASPATVRRALNDLEVALGDALIRRPDRDDLRRVICNVDTSGE